jgi:TRAP-type mannitol/chloroaromatic compound transport system permease small subunit
MRNTAERIADSIDRAIAAIGRAATWCCLYIVLAEFAVVVMRYALGLG